LKYRGDVDLFDNKFDEEEDDIEAEDKKKPQKKVKLNG
jgi:hypothetical protein